MSVCHRQRRLAKAPPISIPSILVRMPFGAAFRSDTDLGVLQLHLPSFTGERLEVAVGFLAVAEAPFVRVPDELSGDAECDRPQCEPLDVLRRDGEVRH